MKQHFIIASFLSVIFIQSFGQAILNPTDTLFLNGVYLDNPNYRFAWNFSMNDFPSGKFKNLKIKNKGSGMAHITFDSAFFLKEIVFSHVIVKCLHKKNEVTYKMFEFVGMADFDTLNKLSAFFNYNWTGWVFYPKEHPLYKFRMFKRKKNGIIVITKITN